MTKQEIFEKSARIIAENTDCALEQIKPESKLMEEMDLTSLDLLILIGELESVFDIHFRDEELMSIITMDDLVQVIVKQMQM